MIDPREKERLFEETIARNNRWLGVIARNNAPIDSCQDLEQEIRIAFWESLDTYRERSSLGTFFFSVAKNTAKEFRRKNHNAKKRDESFYPNPVFVELDRDPLRARVSHPWLPEKEFLAEEREKIAARIALLRRNVWLVIPALFGLLAWQAGLSHSAKIVVALVAIVALAGAGAFWFYRWKFRKDLLPILEDIDRDLEYYRNHPESRLD